MTRLLYLENSASSTDGDPVLDRLRGMGLEVDRHAAFRDDFPADLDRYAAAYLTGSPHGAYEDIPWIHREHKLLRAAAAIGLPMLGVCFGSQILGSALCGRDQVFRRSACEVGYVPLVTAADAGDPLLTGVGPVLRMFVWHNDEVRDGHPDMTILARSADCPNHIWRYRDRPIWGIQGHPEVTPATAPEWLGSHRAILARDGADVDGLIADRGADLQVDRLLENFVAYMRQYAA